MLSPLEIHNKEFRRGMRGYNEDEVDNFLDEVVRDFEMVLKEKDRLQEEIDDLGRRLDQYKLIEDNLHKALLVAENTAEEVKKNAQKEAELIVREAKQQADTLVEEARAKVRSVEHEWGDSRNRFEVWKAKVRSVLEAELRLLDREEGEHGHAAAEGNG